MRTTLASRLARQLGFRSRRHHVAHWLPHIGVVLLASVSATAARAYAESEIQAEFVERFTHFIEWPQQQLGSQDAPFVMCVLGKAAIEPLLVEMAKTRRIKGRRLLTQHLTEPRELAHCHLLWIAESEEQNLPKILARTSGKPILTIGDTEGFAAQGVLVNFVREGNRVAFEINRTEVRKSGLQFSSQLVQLARAAIGAEEPQP